MTKQAREGSNVLTVCHCVREKERARHVSQHGDHSCEVQGRARLRWRSLRRCFPGSDPEGELLLAFSCGAPASSLSVVRSSTVPWIGESRS